MEHCIGVITQKEQKSGVKKDNTPYTRTAYGINNKVYSTFDQHEFNVGENVEFDFETKDQYNNIHKGSMKKSASAPVQPVPQPQPEQQQAPPCKPCIGERFPNGSCRVQVHDVTTAPALMSVLNAFAAEHKVIATTTQVVYNPNSATGLSFLGVQYWE